MDQLKEMLKSQGWTVHMHKRRKKQLKYVYASKREGGKVRQVYIAPLSQLERLTEEHVLTRLQNAKTA